MIETASPVASSGHNDIAVLVDGGDWDTLDDPDQICRAAVSAALVASGRTGPIAVNVLLADDARLGALNTQYRGKVGPTNVLAFPDAGTHEAAGGPPLAGELAVSFQTTAREAQQQNKSLAHHLSHLVVHGTLHLLGFDHQTDAQANKMEEMERHALRRLHIDDPYRVLPEPDNE